MLHLDHRCQLIQREDLAAIPTPPATKRHRPVPHHELANTVIDAARSRRLGIRSETWTVSHEGQRLYGAVDFDLPSSFEIPEGIGASIAVRHANDKSMSVQIVAGARVFVCANGMFVGDLQTIRRRHTAGLVLEDLVANSIDEYLEVLSDLDRTIERLREQRLSDLRAKALIHDLFLEHEVMAPRYLPAVSERYFCSDEHLRQFPGRDRWGLFNACTETMKRLSAPLQLQSHRRLALALLPSAN